MREGRERRRGVVMFKEEEEARKAVEAMDGGSIDLQQIVVSLRLQTCVPSRKLPKNPICQSFAKILLHPIIQI